MPATSNRMVFIGTLAYEATGTIRYGAPATNERTLTFSLDCNA